mmetsp:Transcript_76519/g.234200  ORF Transcript_76519/g.234200 Transcript_76519/m.234200 type:complete len:235 (+) Transcript_76519:911-1615(+)
MLEKPNPCRCNSGGTWSRSQPLKTCVTSGYSVVGAVTRTLASRPATSPRVSEYTNVSPSCMTFRRVVFSRKPHKRSTASTSRSVILRLVSRTSLRIILAISTACSRFDRTSGFSPCVLSLVSCRRSTPSLSASWKVFFQVCHAAYFCAISTSTLVHEASLSFMSGGARRLGPPRAARWPCSKSKKRSWLRLPSFRASATVLAFMYFSYRILLFPDFGFGAYLSLVSAVHKHTSL